MRQTLIAGNWKMNGSRESITELLSTLLAGDYSEIQAELAVMPPFVYLQQVQAALTGSHIAWGAQDVCKESSGAFTGEISASMLNDFACRYVITGHSERRHIYGESNELVAAKFAAAKRIRMCPILCVGETLDEREAGKTLEIVHEQLACVLALIDNLPDFADTVIAYEPVWAIGTGRTATPEQAEEVHAAIREALKKADAVSAEKIRIVYGGSVKPENASQILAMPNIDGALVGGASLKAQSFLEIAKQCNH